MVTTRSERTPPTTRNSSSSRRSGSFTRRSTMSTRASAQAVPVAPPQENAVAAPVVQPPANPAVQQPVLPPPAVPPVAPVQPEVPAVPAAVPPLAPQPQPVVNQVVQPPPIALAARPTHTFDVDPFQGDINPGTTEGQKLYLKATASLSTSERISVTQGNVRAFMDMIETDSNDFAWGELVNRIPVSATDHKSLIFNYNEVSLDMVKAQATRIWANHEAVWDTPFPYLRSVQRISPETNIAHQAIFFLRVRSRMIAKRIQGSITVASWKALLQRKDEFSWLNDRGNYDHDGPTMLKILLSVVNPTTRVGVRDLRHEIRNATLAKFSHNVKLMLENMNGNYLQIIRKGQNHDNFEDDLFDALLTTKNLVFKNFIQRLQDEWESGKDFLPSELMETAIQKYNNMLQRGTWTQSESQDSKLAALATRLKNVENTFRGNGASPTCTAATDSGRRKFGIDEWRLHKQGYTKVVNGVTYWWCPHHKLDGKYDGLYMTHKPSEHDAWKRDREKRNQEWKEKRRAKKDKENSNPNAQKKLLMSDKLKSVLVTRLQCSDADAEDVWADLSKDFL